MSDASDDLRCNINVKLGARETVKKEQGFSSVAENVIDRHSNQVNADGIIALNGT